MANLKISQLSATTESNDNVWIVMNNSGETETFKIKRTDFLSGTTTPVITGNTNSSSGNSISTINSILPSKPNTFSATPGTLGYCNYGYDNIVGSNAIIFGYDNTTGNAFENGGIAFGRQNTYTTDGLLIGYNNNDSRGICIGTSNTGSGNNFRSIKIGFENGTAGAFGVASIGSFNQIGNSGAGSYIVGNNNNIQAPSSIAIGGQHNISQTSAQVSVVLGGLNNDITSTGTHNTIVGGQNNLISGTTSGSTIIGLTGFTSPTTNNTVYVNNLNAIRQINNGYFDNATGSTFTIDWNNGNSQKISIDGDTSLSFTNVRNGAQYRLQVVNLGTHSITGVSASGFSILCEAGVIPNITNNGVDLCVLEVMGTDILVRHFADFSTP